MTRQTTIPNTDPIEPHPEIRTKLHAWLDAVAAAAEARDAVKRSHDTLLDAITEAKIPYYTYDADGKRKRVYPTVADPKLKTQNVASLEPKGRRGRARDVALPIDKEREKAVDALGTPGDRVNALDRALDAFVDAIPDGTKVTGTWNGETHVIADKTDGKIEHRRVSRHEADITDGFERVRSLLDEAEQKQKDATP